MLTPAAQQQPVSSHRPLSGIAAMKLRFVNPAAVCAERVDVCYFNERSVCGGAVTLSGDSRDGAEDGDDETIKIDLWELTAKCVRTKFSSAPALRSHFTSSMLMPSGLFVRRYPTYAFLAFYVTVYDHGKGSPGKQPAPDARRRLPPPLLPASTPCVLPAISSLQPCLRAAFPCHPCFAMCPSRCLPAVRRSS